jgi:hypothetical protein
MDSNILLILESIKNIEKRLELIEQKLTSSTEKMNEHISFIENTYSALRVPLNYVKQKVEMILGTKNPQLK